MRVVIPSRKRVKLCRQAIALYDNPLVVVAEQERQDYAGLGVELLCHPNLEGLCRIRQWILDQVPDKTLVMSDDDLVGLNCLVGSCRTIRRREDIMAILENAALIAEAIGAPMFGFCTSTRPMDIDLQDPLRFDHWVSFLYGFVGRSLRFDLRFKMRDDLDICLQALLKERIIFQDTRFTPLYDHSAPEFKSLSGGNAIAQTHEQDELEKRWLLDKWGKWVSFPHRPATTGTKGVRHTIAPRLHVRRRQGL